MTCQPSAQGGRFLQRMLVKELQALIRQQGGDVKAAIPATLQALDHAYRDLHPFNGPVLEGVSLALAYTDLRSQVGPGPLAVYPASRCAPAWLFTGLLNSLRKHPSPFFCQHPIV
jgi:hypothetical protein